MKLLALAIVLAAAILAAATRYELHPITSTNTTTLVTFDRWTAIYKITMSRIEAFP